MLNGCYYGTLLRRLFLFAGPYRIFLSTVGVASSGIASLQINGAPAPPAHVFNGTHAALSFAALPTPAALSAASVESSVTTASTRVDLKIVFKQAGAGTGTGAGAGAAGHGHPREGHPPPAAPPAVGVAAQQQSADQQPWHGRAAPTPPPPPPLPSGLIHHFSASSLASLKDKAPVSSWPNLVQGAAPAAFACSNVTGTFKASPPTFALPGGVVFDGRSNILCVESAGAGLPAEATFVARKKKAVIFFEWALFLISLGSPHVRPHMGHTWGTRAESRTKSS